MASIKSKGLTNQDNNQRNYAGSSGAVQWYHDYAILTGVGVDETVTFREGVPEGALILTGSSFVVSEDQGTGGTFNFGDSNSATAFISNADADTSGATVPFTESTTNPAFYRAGAGFRPILTRKTAAVTGSPRVDVYIAYIPPAEQY